VQRIFAEIDSFLDESDDSVLFADMCVSPHLYEACSVYRVSFCALPSVSSSPLIPAFCPRD
jgi:hypothetical protein